MDHVIAANYLSNLEKCLEQLGVEHFLTKINFDPDRVLDPAAYVTMDELKYVISEAYRLSQCPQLGLIFGQSLSILNHGFLGYAAMSSPTLGEAIRTILSYLNTRTSLLHITLKTSDNDQEVTIEFSARTDDPLISRFLIELAIMHLSKIRALLVGSSTPFLRIELNYDKPPYADFYQELFKTEIVFNAQFCRVLGDAEELNYPVPFADDVSYQLAKAQLQEIVKNLSLNEDLNSKIKSILLNKNLNELSMEDIASQLCMSSRTLRRHLQRLNITYQELFDEVREQKAKAFLLNQHISMTEISFLLGFHDTSNFSKAFKRWTGITPSEYRAQHGIG